MVKVGSHRLNMKCAQSESIVVFEGGSAKQCEDYVRWLRMTAQRHGKLRENDWMVDLVVISLGGEALRWHSRLDPKVANDWHALRNALLDQYSDGR